MGVEGGEEGGSVGGEGDGVKGVGGCEAGIKTGSVRRTLIQLGVDAGDPGVSRIKLGGTGRGRKRIEFTSSNSDTDISISHTGYLPFLAIFDLCGALSFIFFFFFFSNCTSRGTKVHSGTPGP